MLWPGAISKKSLWLWEQIECHWLGGSGGDGENKRWMSKIWRMWKLLHGRNLSLKMKGRINQEFRKVGDVVREGDVVFERE